MIVDIAEERLFVISDLHLGNHASVARHRVLGFLDHVGELGASLCINGDGFEMLQTSISRLATEAIPVVQQLRQVTEGGGRVYYVVGNHDLVLEHFLQGWLVATISPFLNVTSGDQRIRVEHGHIYDPFFARHPDLYETAAWLAGFGLFLSPDTYKLWTKLQKRWEARRRSVADDTLAVSHYYRAADMLLRRGFDTVVFGHTHNAEVVELESGTFVNSGNWIRDTTYVDIDRGRVTLKSWNVTEAPRSAHVPARTSVGRRLTALFGGRSAGPR